MKGGSLWKIKMSNNLQSPNIAIKCMASEPFSSEIGPKENIPVQKISSYVKCSFILLAERRIIVCETK